MLGFAREKITPTRTDEKELYLHSIEEDEWLAVISIEIFEKLKTHEMMTS